MPTYLVTLNDRVTKTIVADELEFYGGSPLVFRKRNDVPSPLSAPPISYSTISTTHANQPLNSAMYWDNLMTPYASPQKSIVAVFNSWESVEVLEDHEGDLESPQA